MTEDIDVSNHIIFHLETTGLSADKDSLVETSALTVTNGIAADVVVLISANLN